MTVEHSTTRTYGVDATVAELDATIALVTDRVADRLIEAIEHDDGPRTSSTLSATALATDDRRQQLLVGGWIGEEVTAVNETRLQRGVRPLAQHEEHHVRARVVAELTGAGPLEPYVSDPLVEEIDVNSPDSTWVTYTDGRKVDVGRLWASAAELTAFQKRMARRMTGTGEGRLDTSSPMLTLQSRDGARIVMVLGGSDEHGVSTHPRMAIRRFVVRQVGLDGLADLGLFPQHLVARLRALVRCGFTILVSGPPGAGKTTLLTELLGEVSPLERIITVEKNLLELRLEDDPRHPDAPALFTRHANAEGAGEITTRRLVELTRRLNPDRVVVGELVEDEALDMLDVASMCKRGSLATIHAHTADIVLQRLAYYVSKSNTSLPEFAVWSLIAQTVDFIVHIDLVRNAVEDQSAVRRVTSIIEVGGLGEVGGVSSTEVWAVGACDELEQVAPLSQRHLDRLRLAGYPADLFAAKRSAMSLDLIVLVVSTLAGVLAVLVMLAGDDPAPRPSTVGRPGGVARAAGAAGAALLVLAASGWLVAAAVIAAGCWYAIGAWQQRDARGVSDVQRIDALASWIENLRDVLIAGDQTIGAINATVATCPAPIKPQVRRLAAGLGRQDPAVVFRRFADDVDDPLGDLVAAGLLIAVQRGARTAAVLGSLAEQARRQADRRRLVEAERAPIQREVTLLTVIMGSLVVGLLVFGRAEYLEPYDTAGGQLFLGLVLTIYAILLLRVQRLARFPRPSRFLTAGGRDHRPVGTPTATGGPVR